MGLGGRAKEFFLAQIEKVARDPNAGPGIELKTLPLQRPMNSIVAKHGAAIWLYSEGKDIKEYSLRFAYH
jgi:hypothetical protein